MPILLCRVDDRLIHGQVVVGWGAQLGLDVILVVDDELSDSDWEQDLYRAGLPDRIEARFIGAENAATEIPALTNSEASCFILTRDLETMRRLAEVGALDGIEVNLGGLHDAPGRRPVLSYLFLAKDDRKELERLRGSGVRVTAQDVPSARKVGLDELLRLRPD
jgi:PTS system mannose-specific IIB component/fructoselysine and glucoselysine-specific PTS system IIB component